MFSEMKETILSVRKEVAIDSATDKLKFKIIFAERHGRRYVTNLNEDIEKYELEEPLIEAGFRLTNEYAHYTTISWKHWE
jgi:hypothetical protein